MSERTPKYRNGSIRLQNWDYGNTAYYFVTICTKSREHYFGKIINGKMELSNIGVLADILWYETKFHFPFVELHSFCVMPNHIHGIIFIEDIRDDNANTCRLKACLEPTSVGETIGQKRFQNQGKNTLSSIIGSYKSAVTKHAHRLGYEFAWQPRFYEHIIRDEAAFYNI